MPALPKELQQSVRINWHLSSWCNYSCQYCPVMVFHQRSKSRQKQEHSFDHQPVSAWLNAIAGFKYENIHLKISGGEPFLDRKNFRDLLTGLAQMKHIRVGIDTNGFWDPEYFRGVDKSNIWLNVAFHPSQVSLDEFLPNLLAIRDAGFYIPMVNFVLAPENLDHFDQAMKKIEQNGFFVNLSTMLSSGVYLSRTDLTNRELEISEKYNAPIDNHFKIVKPKTKGRLCFYPAMTYYIMYDGSVRIACRDGSAQDLFRDGIPSISREAMPCEYEQCIGCTDMYRALADEPLAPVPLKLFMPEDFAEEVIAARRKRERKEKLQKLPLIGAFFQNGTTYPRTPVQPAQADMRSIVPDGAIGMALPDAPVFGHSDHTLIQARSRDRISISGWAASREHGVPAEVRLTINGEEIGVIRHFFERPDVARTYARPDLAKCGWRTMVYLPALTHGEYDLVPIAYDATGHTGALAATRIQITD